jgi:hypothetical protein
MTQDAVTHTTLEWPDDKMEEWCSGVSSATGWVMS